MRTTGLAYGLWETRIASKANISWRCLRTSSYIEGGIRWKGSLNGEGSYIGILCFVFWVRPMSRSWQENAMSYLWMSSFATSIWSPVRRTHMSSQSNWSSNGTSESISFNASGGTTEVCCRLQMTDFAGTLIGCLPKFFTSRQTLDVPGDRYRTHGVTTTLPPRGLTDSSVTTVIRPENTGAWTIPSI